MKKDSKGRLTESQDDTIQYINDEIKNEFSKDELSALKKLFKAKIANKSIGGYFDHILRDAFSHVGFLTGRKNNYVHGYPTLNPTSSTDILKYEKANEVLKILSKKILSNNEPTLSK